MASFKQNENSKLWSVRFRIIENYEEKHKRLSGYKTKKEANSAYVAFMASYISPKEIIDNIDFNQLYLNYLTYAKNRMKESSYITLTQKSEKHILPYFKDFKIDLITERTIADWQNYMCEKGLSYKYLSGIFTHLITILNYGKKFFKLTKNVASEVGNFKRMERKKEMLFWTSTEFEKFIGQITDIKWKTLFSFLYLTGCRRGEMLALTWKDIDLKHNLVNIDKTLTNKTLIDTYRITSPKSISSVRKILISDNLNALLESYLKYCTLRNKSLGINNFVFGYENNCPLPAQTLLNNFEKLCKQTEVTKIRIHDFRHSHASFLISQGFDIVTISKRLGHSNIEETLNTYAHMFPNQENNMTNSLNLINLNCT